MSLNEYNPTTGELTNIASSSRIWTGTKEEWQALVNSGTAPKNCLVAITDDSEDNNYSTDEKLTGKFWVDGKPIYRKVIDNGSWVSNFSVDISTYNIDTLIHTDAIGANNSNGTGSRWCLNSICTASREIVWYQDENRIVTNGEYYKRYLILEYTKTTD